MSQAPHGGTLTYWPALDGVRALAVTAVLLFHGGVAWLPGGFLGVDAFFVLSGFLITSLLLAEYGRTGRIRLGHFWLRRARRLLPALLLLLLFVVAVFPGTLPPHRGQPAARRRVRCAGVRGQLAHDLPRRRLLRPDLGAVPAAAHLVARDRGAVLRRLAVARGGAARVRPAPGAGRAVPARRRHLRGRWRGCSSIRSRSTAPTSAPTPVPRRC